MGTFIVVLVILFFGLVVGGLAWWVIYVESVEKRAAAIDAGSEAKGRRRSRINRWIWTACMDDETCEGCRQMDAKEWKRKKEALQPPLAGCRSLEGCRCQLVGVYDDEGKIISEN